MSVSSLKSHLEALYRRYGSTYLETDPIRWPRSYARPDDREVIGFVASALAYGRVPQIQKSIGRIAETMGPHPAAWVRRFDPARGRKTLRGFAHRFNDARDVGLLLWYLRQMLSRHGSIEEFFLAGRSAGTARPAGSFSGDDGIGEVLSSFAERALALDCAPYYRSGVLPTDAGVRFFFPSPRDGSTCKRLNLYLRWMVRRDDGVDMGVWRGLSAAHLVIPLDTHVSRICSYIGLTQRRTVGWRMALEVTRRLRELDPDDPIKYDFALCRLGILEACPRHRDPVCCAGCDLRSICRLP